jgi:hypothetical protein
MQLVLFVGARLFLSLSSPSAECTRRQSRLKRRRVIKSTGDLYTIPSTRCDLNVRFSIESECADDAALCCYIFALCVRNNVAHNRKRVSSFILEITYGFTFWFLDELAPNKARLICKLNRMPDVQLSSVVHYRYIQYLMWASNLLNWIESSFGTALPILTSDYENMQSKSLF